MTITKIMAEINKRLLELDNQYEDISADIVKYRYLGDDKRFDLACNKRNEISSEISVLKDILRVFKNNHY